MPFKKGQSGNPKGGKRRIDNAARMARQHAEEAIATLVNAMRDTAASQSDRIKAANTLIERGFGKAKEHVEIEQSGTVEHVGLPEIMARIDSDLQRSRAADSAASHSTH